MLPLIVDYKLPILVALMLELQEFLILLLKGIDLVFLLEATFWREVFTANSLKDELLGAPIDLLFVIDVD